MQDNKLIKALVADAQQGNNSAFGQLYQITIDFIYALVLRLTGNALQSDVLTKNTYINAWQQISEKDENTTFLVWLKKIAVETYLANFDDTAQSSKESEAGIKSESNIADNVHSKHSLEKHLLDLDRRSRLIYILHDIENLSYNEIENFLNIPIQEIKDSIINSREKLISLLES